MTDQALLVIIEQAVREGATELDLFGQGLWLYEHHAAQYLR